MTTKNLRIFAPRYTRLTINGALQLSRERGILAALGRYLQIKPNAHRMGQLIRAGYSWGDAALIVWFETERQTFARAALSKAIATARAEQLAQDAAELAALRSSMNRPNFRFVA